MIYIFKKRVIFIGILSWIIAIITIIFFALDIDIGENAPIIVHVTFIVLIFLNLLCYLFFLVALIVSIINFNQKSKKKVLFEFTLLITYLIYVGNNIVRYYNILVFST